MTADEALEMIEAALCEERLSKLQAIVLRHAWNDQSYQEIARVCGYEVSYVKQTGSQLWQLLSKTFGEKVNKHNLQAVLKRYRTRRAADWSGVTSSAVEVTASTPKSDTRVQPPEDLRSLLSTLYPLPSTESELQWPVPSIAPRHGAPLATVTDWGEATDVSVFYGRGEELAMLQQWIGHDRCRLVGLFGMGGIGKTSLAVKLAEQMQSEFEYVIWRSLRNAPLIQDLLTDLIQFLSHPQEPELPTLLDRQLLRLLECLRHHRCLLILDNGETILRQGDRLGGYQPGYEGYGQLLQSVGESRHQSCLLLTSREKPKGFTIQEGKAAPVRSLQLSGLQPSAAQALFNVKGGFSGSATDWAALTTHYAGNPLALRMIAPAIADFFAGSITKFLELLPQGSSIFGDIHDLLEQQINRLSELEQHVMYWLAINREPLSLSELQADLVPQVSLAHLLEALTALERRSLIEKQSALFTLQPVVMEYMTDRFISQVCEEIQGQKRGGREQTSAENPMLIAQRPLPLLHSHALIKATAKDYIRETQVRLMLQSIVDRLLEASSRKSLGTQLLQLLPRWRQQSAQETGYAVGNLLNLLCHLQVDLSDRDFSHLVIRQAYLRRVNLHRTNVAYADLSKSVFTELFSQILSVAFSPNGLLLAASDASYETHVWRVADGQKLLTCRAADGWGWAVAFSPDSRILASSANGTINLWDAETGQCLRTLQGYTSRIFSLAFSPDGVLLASGSEDHHVRIWHVNSGQLLHTLTGHTHEVHSVTFAPVDYGFWLLASGSYDRTVRLWNSTAGTCLGVLAGQPHWVWAVAFSPDGQTLASSSDRTVQLWNVAPLSPSTSILTIPIAPFMALNGHSATIRSIAWSADGQTLASGSDDQSVRLWNIKTGECLRGLQGHSSWISSIAFSPDGGLLVSASEDQSIRLWDSRTAHCLRELQGYSSGIWSVAFSPDGNTLASGGHDRSARLWNLAQVRGQGTGDKELAAQGHAAIAPPSPAQSSPFNVRSSPLPGHIRWVWSVAFSPNGDTLATASEDCTIRLWDVSAQTCINVLHGHTNAVWSVTFSPDGQTLVSGSLDGAIKLWCPITGNCRASLPSGSGIWSVAFSADGTWVASGGQDQLVRLWHSETGECIRNLAGHHSWIRCVTFSPDRQLLASCSSDGSIKLWHLETGECWQTLHAHSSLVLSVTFSPDGKTLASSGGDGIIKVWEVATGQCRQALVGHDRWVRDLAFSQDGQMLASCSQDETIRLWDTRTGRCLETLRIPRPYEGMTIAGAIGLTAAQKATLTALGAIDTL